jgi:YHS domain-containing protein
MQVRVSSPYLEKAYSAQVANVFPRFDPISRALQVRLEADNPCLLLRPDMFVDVELPVILPAAITVPVDALIETGLKKTVYVDLGDGYFEPRPVETGWRFGKQVEITGGLMPGEKVVVSGNFLIDSESRLRNATAGIRGEQKKDLVCGMLLDEKKAREIGKISDHEGQTYFFCSDECRKHFESNPKKYIEQEEKKRLQCDRPTSPAPVMDMPGAVNEPNRPVPSEQPGASAQENVKNMPQMGEQQDIQGSALQPAMPEANMEMRGTRRRRGGLVPSGQPAMNALDKDTPGEAVEEHPDRETAPNHSTPPTQHDHEHMQPMGELQDPSIPGKQPTTPVPNHD